MGVTEAFAITRAVGSAQVKVLYDLYHEQRSQGNLLEKLERNIDQVGLIHIADVPGRHEPGTGEVRLRRGVPGARAAGIQGRGGDGVLTRPATRWRRCERRGWRRRRDWVASVVSGEIHDMSRPEC